LLVKATAQDLDIIEAGVQILNITPPEVNIAAKFLEVSQNDTRALGFDWIVGNTLMNNGSIGAQGGTAPSFTGQASPGNPSGVFPTAGIAPSPSDGVVTSGLRNTLNAPALGTITGILTQPQFRFVIHALEQRDGADLLEESSVTTLSGRQTQILIQDIQSIVIGPGLSSGSTTTVGTGVVGGGGVASTGASISYPTQAMPFGPTLDVVPYVCADGYTIQLSIIPTLAEFIGYDNPGQFVPQAAVTAGANIGQTITAVLPLPHYRVRTVTTSVSVWDSQTVMLGGLIVENVQKSKDKIPVLGDLPFIGRFFRSESSQSLKKNLMIFVTPTIIDPAGNRLHSDDEQPFAQAPLTVQPRTIGMP
jgi:general secretion pathway protein D